MAHTNLRRGQHQVGLLEAWRMGFVKRQVRIHRHVRADFHRRQIVHIQGGITCLPWPHEQSHIIAPGDKWPVKQTTSLTPFLHEVAVGLGLLGAKRDPAVHIHTRKHPRRVHAMVHILFFNVIGESSSGAGKHIAIASGINHHIGQDGHAPFLALEGHAFQSAAFHQGSRHPRVINQLHLAFQQNLLREQLQSLGVDGGRPGDDAVVSRSAKRPMFGGVLVLRAPICGVWTGHSVGGQTIKQFLGKTTDHQLALPVGHAVDPNHQAAGGEPSQVVVALEQNHIRTLLGSSRRRRRARRPTAHHQDLTTAVDRDVLRVFLPKTQVFTCLLRITAKHIG